MKILLIGLFITSTWLLSAQEENRVNVEIHGFVNNEVIYDTRQVQSFREGEVMVYPKKVDIDANGNDRNSNDELSIINFHSRIQAAITGPNIGIFKPSAVIEGDFLGSTETTPNSLRLRHAYFKLVSPKSEWIAGQYWHPMFINECYPDIPSWNAAIPFHLLNRAPQIRYSYLLSSAMRVTLAAVGQRDYSSHGPLTPEATTSTPSSVYLRRSGMPDMQTQIHIKTSNIHLFGVTAGYKTIVPRISTATTDGLAVKETLGSYNVNVYSRIKTQKLTWMLQGIYGQNLSHYLMLGGYGIMESDPITKEQTYANIEVGSIWTDLAYQLSSQLKAGIFCGVTQNMGAGKEVNYMDANGKPVVYGFQTDIDKMISISPRLVYTAKQLKLAIEWNHLTSHQGTIQKDLSVGNTQSATNNRFLFSTSYIF